MLSIRALDFDYIQPPLGDGQGKCYDLLLTVLVTPRIPYIPLPSAASQTPQPAAITKAAAASKSSSAGADRALLLPPAASVLPLYKQEGTTPEGKQIINPSAAPRGVPSKLIRDFLDVFWRTMVPAKFDYKRDPDYMMMMRQLAALPYIRCYDLPWVRPARPKL